MFGNDIVNVFWVSKIYLEPYREEAIGNCFADQNAQLHILIMLMILII